MKLQSRLLVSILPVVILVITLGMLIVVLKSTSAMEGQIKANAQLLGKGYAGQLDAQLLQYRRISGDLSSSVITSVHVETTLLETRKRYPEFAHLFYTDATGRVLQMAPWNQNWQGYDFSTNPDWLRARETLQSVYAQPDRYFGQAATIIFAPAVVGFVANARPTVVGMVCVVLPLKPLFTSLNHDQAGTQGELHTFSRQGFFLDHADPSWILERKLTDLESTASLQDVQSAMIRQQQGFATYFDSKGKRFISFNPIPQTGWSFGVFGDYGTFTSSISEAVLVSVIVVILGVLICSLILYLIVHSVARPIVRMTEAVGRVEQGDLHFDLELRSSNEVGILSRAIKGMTSKLLDQQQGLERMVEERTLQLQDANVELSTMNEELLASNSMLEATRDALWGEMELAHKLQTVLLPQQPRIGGYDIAAFMVTTTTVGGDYYDVIHVDGHDWFLIGDVSGHGVTAGLIMMMVQTSIHIALTQNPKLPPEQLLTLINKTIHTNIHKLGSQRYMTLTVFAEHRDGCFTFSGAHLPLLHWKAAESRLEITETPGAWIGLVPDIAGKNQNSIVELAASDVLLLYTDGITEAVRKSDRQPYSQDSLAALFSTLAHLSASEICESIRREMETLDLDDDVTIFVIKKRGA